ncbi:MAG: hypothetical protein LWX83_11795 [Anaerolineae bacterium]|nr:hypothetical protein [Anaerolineae bacterium]
MTGLEFIFGFILILVSVILMAVFYALKRKQLNKDLRPIEGIENLKQAAGLSVEEGKRMHISLGSAGLISPYAASSLAGISALERLSRASIASDRPPIATSGEGSLNILAQETLKTSHRFGSALESYDSDHARVTGITPFTYAVGAIPAIRDPRVSTNILIGHLGPEAAFLTEAANQQNTHLIAASDSLEGQSVLFAESQNTLLAEELYALPAYLQSHPAHQASLRVQDILRWVLAGALIIGAVVKLGSALMGAPLP